MASTASPPHLRCSAPPAQLLPAWHWALIPPGVRVQALAAATREPMLQQFTPQHVAMVCEGLARMGYLPDGPTLHALLGRFRGALGGATLMDCTTLLSALGLWGVLGRGVAWPHCEALLAALQARWQQGFLSAWYIAGTLAPHLQRLARSPGAPPAVHSLAASLLRQCLPAMQEAEARRADSRPPPSWEPLEG